MIHLLSLAGRRALAELVATEPVLAFTFDGTLAPPVVLPSQARMQPALERCFRDLCALLPVAVITGRSLDDVEARLPVRPAYLVGNHGSGCLPGQEDDAPRARNICAAWLRQMIDEHGLHKVDPGLLIADHGCSLWLHYRLLRDRPRTMREIERVLGALHPAPVVVGARSGINLLPPDAPGKRTTLNTVLDHASRQTALYIGEDEADEQIFRDAPESWLTVRIGRSKDSAARYFLHHQFEVLECLQFLLGRIRRHEAAVHA